ncbi:CubicO group peptidase (beta-lactamase class C family) [Kordia periserrulae]|uniref:CubicO group peptidase (Beta-lactamase class C family) n=1 Tax=Kordia periserrulae TaxID=701523 RepID=A0A2T6BSE7_9FLAO|nr:serine hydrolase [Kordia periserrulae]PTX59021.1 CubicO group peptidase (beta-lactamase class C family) [Kordia periserrulae]
MKKTLLKNYLFLLLLAIPLLHYAQNDLTEIDNLMSEQYKENASGATILVAKDGEVVFRKAYGKANLELNVDMKPENVFEIGSITKQFTAVGVLMLLEEGKLSLEDEITKYLPEYPTQDTKITIHHLLTHTSGIKSYTSMPSLQEYARKDVTPMELIDSFKNEPMDFKPGEQYLYNNSGYVILGYIIEKITGKSYEEFIQKRIFDKLNMNNSYYGSKSTLIENRANGYQQGESGYVNANYLSMTIPYAAGSLMSTVDDLFTWNTAIRNHKLISKESTKKAFTNYTLNNGSPINYGYGWQTVQIKDVPVIAHGGGIFGYTSQGVYVPSENVYVIILTNCNCNSPSEIAYKVAAIAIGKSNPKVADAIKLNKEQLQKWVGAYKFEDGTTRFITLEDHQLYSQRMDGNTKFKIYPISENQFFFADSFSEFIFSDTPEKTAIFRNQNGEVTGVWSDEKMPAPKKEIQLPEEILQTYIGTYELTPNLLVEITLEDGKIFAQPTNQSKAELFAESERDFFLKVVPATITFTVDETTKLPISFTLSQGGREMVAKKIK